MLYNQHDELSSVPERVPWDGGSAVPLLKNPTGVYAYACAFSPDGKWIACRYLAALTKRTQLAVIPSTGGTPSKVFDMPASPGSYWLSVGTYPDPPVREILW